MSDHTFVFSFLVTHFTSSRVCRAQACISTVNKCAGTSPPLESFFTGAVPILLDPIPPFG
jgi:hypothetical protein